MNNKTLLVLFLGVIVGCVANEAVRAGTVTAQATPSAPGQFRECVTYTQLGHDSDHEDLGANSKSIVGWIPVGGTIFRGAPAVVLCR